MASPSSAEHQLPVVVSPYADEPPMPASATGTLFVLASGFGIGALILPQWADFDAHRNTTS